MQSDSSEYQNILKIKGEIINLDFDNCEKKTVTTLRLQIEAGQIFLLQDRATRNNILNNQ